MSQTRGEKENIKKEEPKGHLWRQEAWESHGQGGSSHPGLQPRRPICSPGHDPCPSSWGLFPQRMRIVHKPDSSHFSFSKVYSRPVMCKNNSTCNSKRFPHTLLMPCVLTLLCSLPNASPTLCIPSARGQGCKQDTAPAKRGTPGPTPLAGPLAHLHVLEYGGMLSSREMPAWSLCRGPVPRDAMWQQRLCSTLTRVLGFLRRIRVPATPRDRGLEVVRG